MKKALFVLPLLMLSACNNQQAASPTNGCCVVGASETQRYAFELNAENMWYFIDSEPSETGGMNSTLFYTFQGVLSFAYYDNVIVHLDYDIVGIGGSMYPSTTHKADVAFKLNASGSGVLSLPCDYVPQNAEPEIPGTSLYGFNRSLTIKSVSGTVRFAI